jgi:hypothetical protein
MFDIPVAGDIGGYCKGPLRCVAKERFEAIEATGEKDQASASGGIGPREGGADTRGGARDEND